MTRLCGPGSDPPVARPRGKAQPGDEKLNATLHKLASCSSSTFSGKSEDDDEEDENVWWTLGATRDQRICSATEVRNVHRTGRMMQLEGRLRNEAYGCLSVKPTC